ncbi:hypothetical protein C9J44_05280 [Photobacterium sp. GB-27]|uniref:biosynthetic peptidoglycan transglycosylase n=1 Tax=Photobacterium sp. GB-27 TaxID=2022109 RepID=UPI000D15B2D8|nr:biosynthetic peptidoglycan transglycosylase [Photobacterium sp. GB-27]PSV38431.1 hypothetical protein C9J44_05280 [Photobacterium sp. GB-27]
MKFFYFLFSIPFILLSHAFRFNKDYSLLRNRCILVLSNKDYVLPDFYYECIVLAEDRRSKSHFGVDFYAIFRSVFIYCKYGTCQGGSTIEQQFVRVVTNKYERTMMRKIQEQLLAFSLYGFFSKKEISDAYLNIAYMGTEIVGIRSLSKIMNLNIIYNDKKLAIESISRLKYPEPKVINKVWINKITNRKAWILNKLIMKGKYTINYSTL